MQLSNSSISIFCECPKCFWLAKNRGLERPRGIFSSLPNGIDGVLKSKLESFRGATLPALEIPQLEGFTLYDNLENLKKMRNWKTNPYKYHHGSSNVVVGAFDDVLHHKIKKLYVMLDYKTKGSEPDLDYCRKYYQKQVNMYTLFLEEGKLQHPGFGVLYYFWPVRSTDESVRFESKAFILEANPDDARKVIGDAFDCLSGPMPEPAPTCEYCTYFNGRLNLN